MKGAIRPDVEAVMDRTVRFHASDKPGQALIDVNVPVETAPRAKDAPPRRKLNEWAFPDELHAYLDQRFPDPEPYWQARQQIHDDRIPVTCPHFGIVEHYAFLGSEVTFTETHSWGHPVVTSWDKLASLELSEDALWFRILMDAYDHLLDRMGDRMVPCLRGLMLPMDLANAIRGDDFFTDLYLYPDEVRELLAFCTKAGRWFIGHQKQKIGSYCCGTMCGGGIWLPGNSIGHLSEDASVMCSPASYHEFGLPYTTAVLSGYDEAFMHLHGAGAHAFEEILSNPTITCVELTNDPGQARSIELYRQYFELLENRATKLFVTPEEITNNLDLLKRGRTILWTQTRTQKEGVELIATVREQLPVAINGA